MSTPNAEDLVIEFENQSNYVFQDQSMYLAYIKKEFLCERFDRRHAGAFNKYGDYIPYDMKECTEFSIQTTRLVCKEYKLDRGDFNKFSRMQKPMSFEHLTHEYDRLLKDAEECAEILKRSV